MSSGGYEVPYIPSPFTRHESRRSSGSISCLQRIPRQSPSPTSSRRPYDSYVPPRTVPAYHEENPNAYRSNVYRPDYPANNLYSRSPSPDRYNTWERPGGYWQQPPFNSKPLGRPERKPVPPPSPTASVRSRGRGDDTLATRMFEPSENWKQTNVRNEGPSSFAPERYPDHSPRSFQDGPVDPPARPNRMGGDRYRPPPPNPNALTSARTEYESYRPGSDAKRESRSSFYPDSQPASSFRRDALPAGTSRWGDHYEPGYSDQRSSRFPSRSGSPEYSVSSSMHSDSGGRIGRRGLSRPSSRSSIASTHASDPSLPPKPGHSASNSIGSSHHSRNPSDSGHPPGLFLALAHKEPPTTNGASSNGQIPGLSASLPAPPPPVPPTQPAPVIPFPIKPAPAKPVAEPAPVQAPEPEPPSQNGNTSMDIDVPPVKSPVLPKTVPDTNVPQTPVSESPPAPAPAPLPSPPQSPMQEVRSPTPPPWQDTSEILFERKLLFPPDALPVGDPPPFTEASSMSEALRSVVQLRMIAVVMPIILANMNTAASHDSPDSTPDSLIDEVLGGRKEAPRMKAFEAVRPRLSKEYLRLHERWRAHCSALSDHQKSVLSAMTRWIPNYLSMRNAATIPDMISVTQGQVDYLFDDTNHLVENPREYFAPDTGIDDWTDEEKRIFIDKFAQFPKQFGIIAEYIPHKTASQCVDYYYLHKKRQIDFRKVVAQLGPKKRKRRGGGKKKGNALLTDIAAARCGGGEELGRRGGRPPKVNGNGSTPVTGDNGAGNSATATPQPEPRSARLQAQQAAALLEASNPATPEPEGRPRRRGRGAGATSATAPVSASASVMSVSAPISVIPTPSSGPTPGYAPTPSPLTSAPPSSSAVFPTPGPAPANVPLPPTPISMIPCPPPSSTAHCPCSHRTSGSSGITKPDDDDSTTLETDLRPKRAPKRGRKQVKSVAIIHEEPPSPPPESALQTPAETSGSGQPEPSSVLTKATKLLSEFEEKEKSRNASTSKTGGEKSEKGKGRGKNKDRAAASTEGTRELPEAEKNLFLDLLVQYGLDFKRLALAMPGRSSHDLEKWYHTNQQKLKLNEAWQERVTSKAAEAAAGGHPYTITQSAAPTPTLMGSLSWVHEDGTPRPSSSASGSTSGGGVRPDYPMAIPYKPRSIQTAIDGSSLPSNIAWSQLECDLGWWATGPVHSGYHHTPYGPSVSMPPYAYAYPPHHSPYYAAHTTYGAPAYTPMGLPGDGNVAAAGVQGGFGEAGDSEERSEHKAS
ncbi:hypothetical protein DFP72DRAFT_871486 [Ephemerocybe angulata]|uniref:SANT domain-containing protein n=1 Tax=Ephemerocybe angulata TaxID=980116 RepID=A0A8H6IEV4_9AGAR|nr:hypothetical protein DFP72DRAFT_871486 [Tulosesus angulatus]